MPQEHEAVLLGQLLLQLLDTGIVDLDDLAAGLADDVVVVTVGSGHFVAGDAVTEVDLRGHAGIAQELERPVDGGLADARVQLLDMLIELLQRVVAGELKKASAMIRLWAVVFRPLRLMNSRNASNSDRSLFSSFIISLPPGLS